MSTAVEQLRLACSIDESESLSIAVPSGGLTKGQVLNVTGTTWGFAFSDVSPITSSNIYAEKVLIIVKAAAVIGQKAVGAIAAGAKVYWDNSAKKLTTTSSGNTYFGIARKAALSADTEVEIVFDRTGDL